MFDDWRAVAGFVVLLLVALVAGAMAIAAGWAGPPECDRCGCEMEWVDGFHGRRFRCPACGHRRPA